MTSDSPPPFRQRLVWDAEGGEIRDGAIRYLILRPDGLMGMFGRMSPETRVQALAALAASIEEHGGGSARKYRDMGAAAPEALLTVIAGTAPQLGWGRWHFGQVEGGRLDLMVGNSPFAAGHGPAEQPVCAPISGMFAAVAGMVLGTPATVEEVACAATGAADCRFVARTSGTGPA